MQASQSPSHALIRATTVAGIEFAELQLDPPATTARSVAPWLDVIFVSDGSLVAEGWDERRRYEPGRAFARWVDDSITLTSATGARYLSLQVPIGWRGLRREGLRRIIRGQTVGLDTSAVAALRTLQTLWCTSAEDSVGARALLEGHAIAAMGAAIASCEHARPRIAPAWLDQVESIIRDVDTPVSASKLSKIAGVHRTQLQRMLRDATGHSVRELRRHAQVDRACELIRAGDRSLADVAIACGFGDQAHFSRAFKQVTGLSPARYRALAGTATPGSDAASAAVDPVGTFAFSSTSARGIPYDGTLVIAGTPNRYVGRFHTPIVPDGDIESVAVCGRTVTLNITVPAGAAVIRLRFRGSSFTGDWRVGNYGAPVSGHRVAFSPR